MLLDESLKSKADVVSLVTSLAQTKRNQLKKLHDRIKKRRNRYYLDHYDKAPEEGEEQVHIASEMRLVDKAYGLLTSEKPDIKAYPEDETDEGLKHSDKLEAWLDGVMYEQRRRQAADPFDLATMDMLITGMACMFTYWDISLDSRTNWEAMEEGGGEAADYMEQYLQMPQEQTEEQPQLGQLPIIIKRRDPIKVLPEEGGNQGRWKWVIYEDKISAMDVETEWGVILEDFRDKNFKEKSKRGVKVWDCWSWEADPTSGKPILFNTVIAGKQLIKPPTPMPRYEQMPFEIFFCRTTGEPEWERKGLPIIAQIEKTTGELEAAWNARMRMAKLVSQLPILHWGTQQDFKLAAGFGKVAYMGADTSSGMLKPMEYGGMTPDYDKMTGMLHAEVEAGGLGSPVMGGGGAKESGYALGLRGEAGTLNLIAPQQSLSLAMSNVFQQVCGLAASFAPEHEMRVMGRFENQRKVFALTGEQCQGFFIDVGISAQFPQDKDRKMAWAVQFGSQPPEQRLLDDRTIVEDFMGYKNYQRIKERKLQDMAEAHPAVQASVLAEALEKRGMGHWIQMIFPELMQQQPGVPPGEGTPTSLPVEGVPTDIMPQEMMGAQRSQEMGLGPKGRMFPEEEIGEQLGITTA